jgi:hypothetical protein
MENTGDEVKSMLHCDGGVALDALPSFRALGWWQWVKASIVARNKGSGIVRGKRLMRRVRGLEALLVGFCVVCLVGEFNKWINKITSVHTVYADQAF